MVLIAPSMNLLLPVTFDAYILSEASPSTPVSCMSSLGQPMRSIKIILFGSLWDRLTRALTVSGICMVSQLLLVIFFVKLRLINWNPPSSFHSVQGKWRHRSVVIHYSWSDRAHVIGNTVQP